METLELCTKYVDTYLIIMELVIDVICEIKFVENCEQSGLFHLFSSNVRLFITFEKIV